MKMFFKLISLILFLIINQINWNEAKKVRIVELTNDWTLKNLNGSIEVFVPSLPSGVFTALKPLYGDILHSQNDVDLRWIANETWIYKHTFDNDEVTTTGRANLTFHGIDTISNISLNGRNILKTQNMFVLYSVDVTNILRPKDNFLEVVIQSPLQFARDRIEELWAKNMTAPPECSDSNGVLECYRNMLRKQQMSFGGSWYPAAPSMGIWKPVALEYYEVAIMRDIDVAIHKNATHWTMDVHVILSTIQLYYYAEMLVYGNELMDEPLILNTTLIYPAAPNFEFKVCIKQEKVERWWPNGYGKQNLYPVFFKIKTWTTNDGPHHDMRTTSQKTLKIGFRTIEVVEDIDARGRTFYFRVNDHPIFMKGANFVPTHTLPELANDPDRLDHLFQAAKDMNMNMLRVWAGGFYESDLFYSKADYYGFLIWQDMTFSAATYPLIDLFLETIRRETKQNALRISHHPSLALIATNNEVELYLVRNRSDFATEANRLEDEYKTLFLGTIKHELDVISRMDFEPRPGPMLSTPSQGIVESQKDLAEDPQNIDFGDVHFRDDVLDGCDPEIYPRARFISEFGHASLPILSSWQRTLNKNDSLTTIIRHRNHDPNDLIPILRQIAYQLPFSIKNWRIRIDTFVYFSQITQAMAAKTAMDLFRSLRYNYNTMGALMWQLNDVWVAPTSSIIDFYGNYKIVYYWALEFMKPITVIALYDQKSDYINITITRENYHQYRDSRAFEVVIDVYKWNDLFSRKNFTWLTTLDASEMKQNFIKQDDLLEGFDKANVFLKFTLTENKEIVASNFYYPVPIKDIQGIRNSEIKVYIYMRDNHRIQNLYGINNPLMRILNCQLSIKVVVFHGKLIIIFIFPPEFGDLRMKYIRLEILQSHCSSSTYVNSYSLRITIKYPALFIYMELEHPKYVIEKYRFSENGFTQTEPVRTIHLAFRHNSSCIDLRPNYIKLHTMNEYILQKYLN